MFHIEKLVNTKQFANRFDIASASDVICDESLFALSSVETLEKIKEVNSIFRRFPNDFSQAEIMELFDLKSENQLYQLYYGYRDIYLWDNTIHKNVYIGGVVKVIKGACCDLEM